MSLRIFPVAGGARYDNDWGFARPGGRAHQGNDLFAAEGTPLLAVDDGLLFIGTPGSGAPDPFGGNVVYLRTPEQTYYYAHLQSYIGTPGQSFQVKAGDVVGYLGRTGNAEFTEPHLHFGVYRSGEAQNPFPMLQQASVQAPSGGTGGGLFWPVTLATLAGLGAWAYFYPAQASRTWSSIRRRF